jgi:hypothetical protein
MKVVTRCPVHKQSNDCDCDCDLSYWVCRVCGCDNESHGCDDGACRAPAWERLASGATRDGGT